MQPYTSTITAKGQVTIPVEIRKMLGIAPHNKITFLTEQKHIRIIPSTSIVAKTAGMLKSEHPLLSSKEERQKFEEAFAMETEKKTK